MFVILFQCETSNFQCKILIRIWYAIIRIKHLSIRRFIAKFHLSLIAKTYLRPFRFLFFVFASIFCFFFFCILFCYKDKRNIWGVHICFFCILCLVSQKKYGGAHKQNNLFSTNNNSIKQSRKQNVTCIH